MKITKKSIFAIIECALFVAAILFLIAPALRFSEKVLGVKVVEEISGFQVAFGSDKYSLSFSFVAFLAFLFLIVGAVLSCCKLFVKDAKIQKVFNIVILIVGIVAAVFYFSSKTGLMINPKADDIKASDVADIFDAWDLGVGALFAAILALAGGALACVDQFLIKE